MCITEESPFLVVGASSLYESLHFYTEPSILAVGPVGQVPADAARGDTPTNAHADVGQTSVLMRW